MLVGDFTSFPVVAPYGGAASAVGPFLVPRDAKQVDLDFTLSGALPSGTPATEFKVNAHGPDGAGAGSTNTVAGRGSIHLDAPGPGDWRLAIYSGGTALPVGASAGAPDRGSYGLRVVSWS